MKKLRAFFFTIILLFFPFLSEAQTNIFIQDFVQIDMVKLGPDANAVYDVYTIGDNTQSYTAVRWITPFLMNKYETCYELWYTVRIWAENNGYQFQNLGQEGSGGRRGQAPTEKNRFQPVTMISWHDAAVWCNALSEIYGKTPCYTYKGEVLRDSCDTAVLDLAECDWEADGFRLPSETEWEYAARRTQAGFQRGDSASGQIDRYGNNDESVLQDTVAWYDGNSDGTRTVGTAGTPFSPDALPVPGSGNANGSGLFDMSGNVLEFCWDWMDTYKDMSPGERAAGPEYGFERTARGGSWSPYTGFIFCGDRYSYDPNAIYNYLGFRFCSNAENTSKNLSKNFSEPLERSLKLSGE